MLIDNLGEDKFFDGLSLSPREHHCCNAESQDHCKALEQISEMYFAEMMQV